APLPYRVGEVTAGDLRARVAFEVVDQPATARAREDAVKALPPHLRDDPGACETARADVSPVLQKYPREMPLVLRGQPITDQQLALLDQEHHAFQRSLTVYDHLRGFASLFLITTLFAAVSVIYVVRFQAALAQSLSKITSVCILVAVTLATALLLSGSPWYAAIVPLTVTALILTLAYNPQFALLMSLTI